jgi:hypothetical protein
MDVSKYQFKKRLKNWKKMNTNRKQNYYFFCGIRTQHFQNLCDFTTQQTESSYVKWSNLLTFSKRALVDFAEEFCEEFQILVKHGGF